MCNLKKGSAAFQQKKNSVLTKLLKNCHQSELCVDKHTQRSAVSVDSDSSYSVGNAGSVKAAGRVSVAALLVLVGASGCSFQCCLHPHCMKSSFRDRNPSSESLRSCNNQNTRPVN